MTGSSAEIDYRALASFRYEIRSFLNFSENAARAAGVEPQQHQALLAIKGAPPGFEVTVGFLAVRLHVRHHTAVELSRRLEARRLIQRSRSWKDGRKVELSLTRRGEAVLRKISLVNRNELRTAGVRLIRALQSVIANASASSPARWRAR